MAKLIWKGLHPTGDLISSRPFAITGANLRKHSASKSKTQKPKAKAPPRTRPERPEPSEEDGDDLLLMHEWSEKGGLGLTDEELQQTVDEIDAAFANLKN